MWANSRASRIVLVAAAAALSMPAVAWADTANFDLNGKIYTKYMYQNDATQGCLSMSNPFWIDNIGGHNGACTEFELNITGRVSKYITAGARLQSRWGAIWQDWWENGDTRWDTDNNIFFQNTSGESLGMNHAQYMKLRGTWVRMALPIPTVKWVHVGASDFGMFNEWTIGKSRYIDRDNGEGVFLEGEFASGGLFNYTAAAIALPKLYVGPGWQTGISGNEPKASVWATDWAYALKFNSRPINDLQLTAIGTYIADWEADKNDADLTTKNAALGADKAIALSPRFRAYNGTIDGVYAPSFLDWITVRGLFAYSYNRPYEQYVTNGAANNQGFAPVIFRMDSTGNWIAAKDWAATATVEVFDPLELGINLRLQYFNIGQDFNAIFGSRREADVLLTDGLITTGWVSGGQLPTLNIANEFVDFDEPWFENCIGWKGATALAEWTFGRLKTELEYTYIGYNTNKQNRDLNQYPSFLYTDGFTDTYAYTAEADYANVYDRGRDPRSVYKLNQDRHTQLAVLKAEYLVPGINGLTLKFKGKYILDIDNRLVTNPNDNYHGTELLAWGLVSYQVTNELKASAGYEYSKWVEDKRSGNQAAGFYDYDTTRHTTRVILNYTFGGAVASWMVEYFNKYQVRDDPALFNQRWNVWRSKATLEVGW